MTDITKTDFLAGLTNGGDYILVDADSSVVFVELKKAQEYQNLLDVSNGAGAAPATITELDFDEQEFGDWDPLITEIPDVIDGVPEPVLRPWDFKWAVVDVGGV